MTVTSRVQARDYEGDSLLVQAEAYHLIRDKLLVQVKLQGEYAVFYG